VRTQWSDWRSRKRWPSGTSAAGNGCRAISASSFSRSSPQVWDAEVRAAASGKTLALFRCTQMILRGRG
jgi:hypothetical protein